MLCAHFKTEPLHLVPTMIAISIATVKKKKASTRLEFLHNNNKQRREQKQMNHFLLGDRESVSWGEVPWAPLASGTPAPNTQAEVS